MAFDKPYIQTSNDPYKKMALPNNATRTIYYGEVVSIEDETDGGRIKVKIPDLDLKVNIADVPWSYPLIPKFFHNYPKVGEMVRVFIEDTTFPNRSRFWIGSIISQQQKIEFDGVYTALSTTNIGLMKPQPAISTYPDALGVFPLKEDIALIGRVNTDLILRKNEAHLRAGKHEDGNVLKLNTKNPAQLSLIFETKSGSTEFQSSGMIMADKIALISHEGKPQFKAANLTSEDRTRIFKEAHPMARADVLVEALKIIRKALINHIHGYSGLNADKTSAINDLEKIDFDAIMQKNLLIN